MTEINIPSPQIPFTNLSSLNIKDNSLYHPLRHQQSIWTPSRLQKYYPLYLNIQKITQPIYYPSPVTINNHDQQRILNHDQSSIHQYSSGMSSTISMNKQHDYSDIESIWKGTQLDVRTYSADTPPTPNNICHNSNIIANNPQEDSISSNSQRPNKLIKMIYLPINKLDKNKTRRLIKSTKRY